MPMARHPVHELAQRTRPMPRMLPHATRIPTRTPRAVSQIPRPAAPGAHKLPGVHHMRGHALGRGRRAARHVRQPAAPRRVDRRGRVLEALRVLLLLEPAEVPADAGDVPRAAAPRGVQPASARLRALGEARFARPGARVVWCAADVACAAAAGGLHHVVVSISFSLVENLVCGTRTTACTFSS